jgi:YesN/AraC family two-component response regulator
MYNELIVNTGLENHKVFLQDGFYTPSLIVQPPHKHNYAEIHIAADDHVIFHIGDRVYSSAEGNLLIIPAGVYHNVECKDSNILHTAFQIDFDISSVVTRQISNQTVRDFINAIKLCQDTKNYSSIATYISLFCNTLYPKELCARPVCDYGFLINEFFFKRYQEDLHLCDLAKELNLSERQTERLVIQNTGYTFRHLLASVRINAAKHLLKTTDISLEEVSRHVGYRSYAGFWKAMKKYDD